MAKILRETDNPQFINKNATLTSAEHDNNFIEFQAEINEARGLGIVEAYDNAREYRLDQFVLFEFNIYKFISDVTASGVVPGTDPTKWALSSMAEMLLLKDFIVVTALELSDLQQAGTLSKGREYFINDPELFLNRGYQIMVRAAEINRLAIQASINSLVPDFQDIGDYTGVVGFVANLGMFTDTKGTLNYDNLAGGPFTVGETITGGTSGATAEVVDDTDPTLTLRQIAGTFLDDEAITGGTSAATADVNGVTTFTFNPLTGNVVVWDGRHFRKKTDTPTSAEPDTDGTNYELLPYSLTNGYILDTDAIYIDLSVKFDTGFSASSQYDVFIKKRGDKRDNMVYAPLLFQWGNDVVSGNIVYPGSVLDCLNNLQEIENNQIINSTVTANMQDFDLRNNVFTGSIVDVSEATADFESDGQILSAELVIVTADVLQLNSVPKEIVPAPGEGKMIEVITHSTKIINSGAVTAYTANLTVVLITDTAQDEQSQDSRILLSTTSRRTRGTIVGAGPGTVDQQLLENKALMVSTLTGDPATGTFDIKKFVLYRIINS